MNTNAGLSEQADFEICLNATVPSSSTPLYKSLKNYARATIYIVVKNATTVTGSAITLKQATSIAAGSEKPLSFAKARRNIDVAGGETLTDFTVASDTFTTDTTNSKQLLYVIEVDPATLDVAGGFDCIRVGTADATAATVTVIMVLWGKRYSGVTTPATD